MKKHINQFGRYVVVGILAAIVDFSITWICHFYVHIVVANTLGFFFATVINFYFAHHWVFQETLDQTKFKKYFPRVLVISMIGLVISNLIVWSLIDQLGMSFLLGKIVAAITTLIWNYGARRLFIYNKT